MAESKVSFDDAASALRAFYMGEIRSLVDDVRQAIKDKEITDGESLQEWMHETLDGHQFVIYTHKAQMVCFVSDHDDAVLEIGHEGIVDKDTINWPLLAYCAMEADLAEVLGWEGIDVNDPCPEEDDADEEEADDSEGA